MDKTLHISYDLEIPLGDEEALLSEDEEFMKLVRDNCKDASSAISWCVVGVAIKYYRSHPESERYVKRMDIIQNLINALGKELEDSDASETL